MLKLDLQASSGSHKISGLLRQNKCCRHKYKSNVRYGRDVGKSYEIKVSAIPKAPSEEGNDFWGLFLFLPSSRIALCVSRELFNGF